jgi:metallophosphoesterase (TIGR00282 family)
MKLLFFGDVIGRPGREGLSTVLPALRERHQPDFIVVNAENSAHGKGLTPRIAEELWGMGVDALTMGNHTFDRKEIMTIIDDARVIRPANYAPSVKGNGRGLFKSRSGIPVGVIQVMGRVYMPMTDCPFRAADREIAALASQTKIIFVDHHAEITAEKQALGWYLDGRVSGVVGTHTHIQTADERLLPNGTAYLTDAGACGPHDSVIGADIRPATERFLTGLHVPLTVAPGDAMVCGCVIDIDEATGKARSITRVRERVALPMGMPH